ncbi:MAG: NUDIX hydrolase [Chloroflexota bacterium]
MSHEHEYFLPTSAPEEVRFCVRCGAPMETRVVGDKPRRACMACRYVHFTDPKVGVGVYVMQEEKVLLVRRVMEPERGKWSVPAGFLDQGEDPKETAVREAKEETGLDVVIDSLIDVFHNPPAEGGASIFVLYRARRIGGELAAGDDADDVGFFALDDLPDLAFASTRHAITLLDT